MANGMESIMMLTFCEAPCGVYSEIISLVKKRLLLLEDSFLIEKAMDLGLDDDYSGFEPDEDDLYDLDKPLVLYIRSQVMDAVDIVLLSMDTSPDVDIQEIEGKRFIFTGGQSWSDFPTKIFRDINIVKTLNLFDGMGRDNFNYKMALSEIELVINQARKA